jgi:hypothetical protein
MGNRSGSGKPQIFELAQQVDDLRDDLARGRTEREDEQLTRTRHELAQIQAHLKQLYDDLEGGLPAAG